MKILLSYGERSMKNDQKIVETDAILLAEILLSPSSETLENRFLKANDAADCSGRCDSGGGCKAAW